jgi:hypothetical protein
MFALCYYSHLKNATQERIEVRRVRDIDLDELPPSQPCERQTLNIHHPSQLNAHDV